MRTPDHDEDLINPSLLDPVLIGGVDRRILGMEFLFVVAFLALKGLGLGTIVISVLLVVPAHVASVRMSRVDPRMFDMVLRHLRWRSHYPPHGSYRSVHPPIKGSVRRRK